MTKSVVVVGIKETGNHRAALRLAAQEARYRRSRPHGDWNRWSWDRLGT
jgi:hypothetical protein